VLYTRYPHWGAHSGMTQVVRHLDPSRVLARLDAASDTHDDLWMPHAGLRERLRVEVGRRGMAWYKLSDLAAELRAARACALGRTDVVHFLDAEHSGQYLPALLRRVRLGGARTVATFHQPPELLDGLVNPRLVANLDRVTVVSPTQVEWFRRAVPDDRIDVVRHGIDTEFFSPAARRTDDEARPFRCITVGHWLRDWDAVRAVAGRLAGERIEFHVVTGTDTGLEHLPNVVRHRGVSDERLRDLYREADALFLPLTQSTANNALLEGIACGLPVVSTALESVRAYLAGDEGVLVDGNDPAALADAVVALRDDPARRRAMGERARAQAETLAWPAVARLLERVYAEARRAPATPTPEILVSAPA
jgi:glycosyltransferase involved in cell wall biosynthesis